MSGSRTVVVGCDGSVDSDPALRFAAAEARLRRVDLTVVAAYERRSGQDRGHVDIPRDEMGSNIWALAEAALQRVLGPPAAGYFGTRLVVDEGDPAKVLLKYAADAAMIVIGGRASAPHRLLGDSTGRALLHFSRVPVTIVPSPPGSR